MAFTQAQIPVEKSAEFNALKNAISKSLGAESVERFLAAADATGLRIRQFEALAQKGVFDKIAAPQGGAYNVYQQLPASDQSQIREFYLTQIEEVAPALRGKFRKLYQYS